MAKFLPVSEFARRIGKSPATAYRLVERGEVAHRRIGASVEILASEVDRLTAVIPAKRSAGGSK